MHFNRIAGTRIGFPGHALGLALAGALLALSLGVLAATVSGPRGDASKAIDGWRRLMSGDLRAWLVFAMPSLAWVAVVIGYVRSSPDCVAALAGLQEQDEAVAIQSNGLRENVELETPIQVRKSFREALREDGVGLALSCPAGRQVGTANTYKEDDEMLKRQMVAMALAAAGVVSCSVESGVPSKEGGIGVPGKAPIEQLLKEGVGYADFREAALAAGWKPSGSSECLLITVGSNYKSECAKDQGQRGCVVCSKFPEIDACGQDGYCYMTFTRGGKTVRVTTYGEILDAGRINGGNPPFVTQWNVSED